MTSGQVLLDHHRAQLHASAITDEVIAERGYFSATKIRDLKRFGFGESQCNVPALGIPIYGPDGQVALYQCKSDNPRIGPDGKAIKYETPRKAQMALDIPPRVRPNIGDPRTRLWFTEGIKKIDSAVSHGADCGVGLLGVTTWRGTNEDGGRTVLAEFEHIALNGREAPIVFDSDVMRKHPVYAALRRFSGFLTYRGARVRYVYLPGGANGEKVGLDDFLAAGHTLDDVLALAEDELRAPPEPEEREGERRVGPYRETARGIFYLRPTQSGPVSVQLTNFVARIVGDVAEDDGVEVRRMLEVRAALPERVRDARLAPEKFAAMAWPIELLGAAAILYPGQAAKEHTRAAIQFLSPEVAERTVYAHTGWREHGGRWVYLHAGGAIGAEGAVPGIEIALPGDLAAATLPAPPTGTALAAAVRASLDLVAAAPESLAIPLLAATYRAALGGADFSLALVGPTGAGKSELASLAQRHYGAGFDARHLPASWSSTANALEALLFAAKDCLLTIDDFAPGGNHADVQRLNRDADRILRGQGNHAGRQRLTADARLRSSRPSRALPLITGEDVPRGQSARARALVLEVAPGDLDWATLGGHQAAARAGAYAAALAGFLRWVATRRDAILGRFEAESARLRDEAATSDAHRRTPAIVGSLAAAWALLLDFAVECGACTAGEAETSWRRGWAALGLAATRQRAHQADNEPAARFLELLGSALASGRAHLADAGGNPPPQARRWGWREATIGLGEFERREWRPQGTRLGWVDGAQLYLDRDSALAEAQRLGRDLGEGLAVSGQTLAKRLHERRLLASTDARRETLTIRRTLEGRQRAVLHLLADMLGTPGDDEPGK